MTEERVKRISISRVIGKFLGIITKRFPIPSSWRVKLLQQMGVRFDDPNSVFIGEDVYFDDLCPYLVSVGKNVRITFGTRILTHFLDTGFIPEPNRPFRMYTGEVKIGNNVFVGCNVVIAKPVVISDWAIIGANTVVTKDVPRGAILVGAPAKIIGYRKLKEIL